jgi:phage terminase large subunit-like protein
MTLNFNRWMQSADSFIPEDVWNKNHHGDQTDLAGEECFVGIEIAPSGAASAISFLFPGEITRIKMLYFLAEESLRKNEFYQKNKDYFKVDAGNEVENDTAVKWILEEFEKYYVNSFCFPNTQKNNSVIQDLIKHGYEGNPITQGVVGIANPTEEWEKLLKAEKVEHYNNPVLRWQNSNCLAVRKEAGTRIEKNSNVLGIYACLNAVAQWKTIDATDQDDKLIKSWASGA